MGADYYSRFRVGFEVADKELWIPRGSTGKECSRHAGHEITNESNFCSICGAATRLIQHNTPSSAFQALFQHCSGSNADSDDFWDELCESGVGEAMIQFGSLETVQATEDGVMGRTGIAITVREISEYDGDKSPVLMAEFEKTVEILRDISRLMFGEVREVNLYPSLYVSV
jgi:hypothetical protein